MTIGIHERTHQKEEVLNAALDQFAFDLRVACPGIIRSFDDTRQTATVQPAIRERITIGGAIEWVELPLLADVPVFMPRAGGYCLTLPVAEGDECLIVFGDSSMDAWWQSGGVQNQVLKRRHDLSDAFALIGIWSQPRVIGNYSADSAQLRNEAGTAFVELSSSALTLRFGSNSVVLSASGVEVNP